MESQRFTLNEMMKVVYRLVQKLPAPKSCTNDELDELWYKLLDEHHDIINKIETASTNESYKLWIQRLGPVERDLENVEYEWYRRQRCDSDTIAASLKDE